VSGQHADADGLRLLVVGASSGIGHAVAISAGERGAKVAVAARRMNLLTQLADKIGGSAFELDVEDTAAIGRVVDAAAEALGGLDAVVFTSTVIPFAHIEDTDVTTWLHAFSVNTVGANTVLRAALPHLSENGVVLVASNSDVGRPRAGVAAYAASKAALDEILRGADRELLAQLFQSWTAHGQLPAQMSALRDVANTLVSLVTLAYANPTVVPEVVQLAPRVKKG
jgi:NADP-dependent 3-hydroxy acid dehydrogenase YdfG